MASSHTLRLSEPVQVGGQRIAEVTVRRPKVKDLRALDHIGLDASDLARGIEMAAILTGMSAQTIDELDAADFAAISDVIAGFLPKPQEANAGARS